MQKLIASVSVVTSLSLLFPAGAAAQAGMMDVRMSDPHRSAIEYVRMRLIMDDGADGMFRPGASVTRAEFTVSVVDHLYAKEDFDGCFGNISPVQPLRFTRLFADVPVTEWHAKHLCVAMHAGLIDGNADGNFRPNQAITVAEASKVLAHAYGLTYPSLKAPTGKPWYQGYIQTMLTYHAIDQTMRPAQVLTRAQMAEMFYRLRFQPRFPEERTIIELKKTPTTIIDTAVREPSGAIATDTALIAGTPRQKTISNRWTSPTVTIRPDKRARTWTVRPSPRTLRLQVRQRDRERTNARAPVSREE